MPWHGSGWIAIEARSPAEAEGVVRLLRMRAGRRCIQVSIAAVVTISLTIAAYQAIKSTFGE